MTVILRDQCPSFVVIYSFARQPPTPTMVEVKDRNLSLSPVPFHSINGAKYNEKIFIFDKIQRAKIMRKIEMMV